MVDYIGGHVCLIRTETAPRCRTASGYGSKLPTHWVLRSVFPNHPTLRTMRPRRVYAICYSNAASHYVLVKGKRVFIPDGMFP